MRRRPRLPLVVTAAPTVIVDVRERTVQRLVDDLLAVPEVQTGLRDGDVLAVHLTDGFLDDGEGTIQGGKATMSPILRSTGMTHTISMGGASVVTLANACDPANTAKLLLKGGYVSPTAQRTSTQLAFNALVKTPADARLATYDPALGDSITHGGCTGTLEKSATEGYFQVRLCDADYVVNEFGGVNGKIPNLKLADVCTERRGIPRCPASLSSPLTGGDERSLRTTCEAALGPKPDGWGVDAQFWDSKFGECVGDNWKEGRE